VDQGISGISYIVKGGFNLSNVFVKDNDGTYTDDLKSKPGFNIGITAELPISEKVLFETGLLLSTKGFKINP